MTTRQNIQVLILCIIMVLFSKTAKTEEKPKIRVQGGVAAIENIFKKIQDSFTKETGILLEVKESASEDAIIAVENGEADLAVTGVPWDGIKKLLIQANKKLKNEKDFVSNLLGHDLRIVLLNKKSNVKKLDEVQLMEIATGKIKNWKDVGGADLPIMTVFAEKSPGLYLFWKTKVMKGQEWSMENSRKVADLVAAKKVVAANAGAYTIAPMSMTAEGEVEAPQIPTLGVPLTSYVKGRPSHEIIKLYEYIRGPGQKLIK